MQGNILGQNNIYNNSGEGNANLMFPIYQQTTEPKEKYGIWIKSDEVVDNIYLQDDFNYTEVPLDNLFDTSDIDIGCITTDLVDNIYYIIRQQIIHF